MGAGERAYLWLTNIHFNAEHDRSSRVLTGHNLKVENTGKKAWNGHKILHELEAARLEGVGGDEVIVDLSGAVKRDGCDTAIPVVGLDIRLDNLVIGISEPSHTLLLTTVAEKVWSWISTFWK